MYIKRNGEVYEVNFDNCVYSVKIDFNAVGMILTKLYIDDENHNILTLDVERSPLGVIKTILGLYNIFLTEKTDPVDNIKEDLLINSSNIEDLKQELKELKEFKKEYAYFKEKVWSIIY